MAAFSSTISVTGLGLLAVLLIGGVVGSVDAYDQSNHEVSFHFHHRRFSQHRAERSGGYTGRHCHPAFPFCFEYHVRPACTPGSHPRSTHHS